MCVSLPLKQGEIKGEFWFLAVLNSARFASKNLEQVYQPGCYFVLVCFGLFFAWLRLVNILPGSTGCSNKE